MECQICWLARSVSFGPFGAFARGCQLAPETVCDCLEFIVAYRDMLMEQQNVVRAEVTSASPLPAAKTQAIEERLAAITGKRVSMVATVDPAIVGGVIARVGSTVYDASLATQLKKIRERLTT